MRFWTYASCLKTKLKFQPAIPGSSSILLLTIIYSDRSWSLEIKSISLSYFVKTYSRKNDCSPNRIFRESHCGVFLASDLTITSSTGLDNNLHSYLFTLLMFIVSSVFSNTSIITQIVIIVVISKHGTKKDDTELHSCNVWYQSENMNSVKKKLSSLSLFPDKNN